MPVPFAGLGPLQKDQAAGGGGCEFSLGHVKP